ncbi:MAG: hypothetical protein C5B51_26295 [Terriglobia bacterium]|nr:MAG: hypothetical protein C5B51_26295 [Terriglobia bacterium]
MLTHGADLLFVVFNLDWFQVFRFENLSAVETLHVIHAVPARDYLRMVVITGGLHNTALY